MKLAVSRDPWNAAPQRCLGVMFMLRRTFTGALPLALLATSSRAQAAKKLVVYTSNDSTLNDLVFGAFRAESGIEVEPVAAGSGVVMRRLQAEKARPLGDIVWGVSRSLLQTNKALFEPYASKNRDATPAEFRDPDNLWIGNNLHLLVILQNTKLVPADGPKSWADLLDPKWKGKIAFTDPANSGSAYATVTMLVDLWGGGEAGWKRVAQLFKNLKVLNRSSLVFQGVGNGEYPLGISLEYAGPLWAQGGAPVKVVYPADGTTASMEGVAVIKGGPNTDNAKVFVDYINAKAVREMILKATFRRPTRSDLDLTSLPGGLPPLSQVKLVNYDEEGWTAKRAKTLEQIKDVIQDSR
jgi:iron(III) transport system substrate-binding protein